jgi:hypothetical protein
MIPSTLLALASTAVIGLTAFRLHTATPLFSKNKPLSGGYDENLVEHVKVAGKYDAVFMSRKGDRIKAKYFAASLNGKSIQERFTEWSRGRNIIMYSSGTYMNQYKQPVGLTIDNGISVNQNLENFDGLVIVYATGGVVATNLKQGNLKVKCNGEDRTFDLRNGGSFVKQQFLNCAASVEATVFQTHLLMYNNEVLLGYNSSNAKRERRFLAVCQDPTTNDVTHVVVNTPVSAAATLLEATKDVAKMIQQYGAGKIVFMVNLDTGDGDVFRLFGPDGSQKISGTRDFNAASNLLVYYYE